MKIVVIGASGLIGWTLWRMTQAAGHEVLGTYAKFPIPKFFNLQLHDMEATHKLLDAFQPDAVICCAAWSWVDGCQNNPARAFRENAQEPAALAKLCWEKRINFIYYSTSYVFDGLNGPYNEVAIPHPISIYGESKLQGEKLVLEATKGAALIIRTMGVYGEEPQEKNFVYQVVKSLRAGHAIRIPSDQQGNATHVSDIASMTLSLLNNRVSGVWNVAGPEPTLFRREFALRIAREYELDAGLFHFLPTSDIAQTAPRPLNGGLIIDRAVSLTGHTPSRWLAVPIAK